MKFTIHLHVHLPPLEDLTSLRQAVARVEGLAATPSTLTVQKQEIARMPVSPQVQAIADRLNAASNAISAVLSSLRAQIAAGTPLSAEDLALFDAQIAQLDALGTDPNNPVPAPPTV